MADIKDKPPAASTGTSTGPDKPPEKILKPDPSKPVTEEPPRRPTGTTEAQAEELEGLDVNPKLDNRTGDQRPHQTAAVPQQVDGPEIAASHPEIKGDTALKPQQIPGPEVGHFAEHEEQMRKEHPEWFDDTTKKPLGMRSEGPHGRGEDK